MSLSKVIIRVRNGLGPVRSARTRSRAEAEELMRKMMDERDPVKIAMREIEEREQEKERAAAEERASEKARHADELDRRVTVSACLLAKPASTSWHSGRAIPDDWGTRARMTYHVFEAFCVPSKVNHTYRGLQP